MTVEQCSLLRPCPSQQREASAQLVNEKDMGLEACELGALGAVGGREEAEWRRQRDRGEEVELAECREEDVEPAEKARGKPERGADADVECAYKLVLAMQFMV